MKPISVVLVVSVGWLIAGSSARGQAVLFSPLPNDVLTARPLVVNLPPHDAAYPFGPPPPIQIPAACLWADYQGAAIEHDLYRPWQPRWLAPPSRPASGLLGRWMDGFCGLIPARCGGDCECCCPVDPAAGHGLPACEALGGLCGLPVPPPQNVPVPLPTQIVPVPVPPSELVPVEPPLPAVPDIAPLQPSENAPAPVPPGRLPVVELAPDFVLPPESFPPPPRNQIPPPGEPLPRNSVPR